MPACSSIGGAQLRMPRADRLSSQNVVQGADHQVRPFQWNEVSAMKRNGLLAFPDNRKYPICCWHSSSLRSSRVRMMCGIPFSKSLERCLMQNVERVPPRLHHYGSLCEVYRLEEMPFQPEMFFLQLLRKLVERCMHFRRNWRLLQRERRRKICLNLTLVRV